MSARLYPDNGGIVPPRVRNALCCAVCVWPRNRAVHLPALGQAAGAPAWDHEFIDPDTRRPYQPHA